MLFLGCMIDVLWPVIDTGSVIVSDAWANISGAGGADGSKVGLNAVAWPVERLDGSS